VNSQGPHQEDGFLAAVARVRGSGILGESGRLCELFEYLAGRGYAADAATQADIAEAVFGQTETTIDDATVRVYIHRLRKRLEEFYRSHGDGPGRLAIPPGTYALRLVQEAAEQPAPSPETAPVAAVDGLAPAVSPPRPKRRWIPALAVLGLLLLAGAFLLGRALPSGGTRVNAFWEPFLTSERPTLIVLGDYYIYGEIDPVRPDEGRLIRDFRVDSAADLVRMQELMPDRFGNAEDVGLNYLPFSAAYGMQAIAPILAQTGRDVRVVAASELEPNMLNEFDVVYIGLFSGMRMLEDLSFMSSGFELGESYDELVDRTSGQVYVSEEARRLTSLAYYRDYGYVARFRTVSGALVAVVAGARDTGLRGVAPIIGGAELPQSLAKQADGETFEALYQITGQRGADLSERLLVARARPAAGQLAR
jgi:hypothetical protein